MALSPSVVSELLDAFRAGEGVDLIRESVRMVMHELIETEAAEQVGAGRYERTDSTTSSIGQRQAPPRHARVSSWAAKFATASTSPTTPSRPGEMDRFEAGEEK